MDEIKTFQNKYKFVCSDDDDSIPYKYIRDTINELSADIKKIETITIESKDHKEVLLLCNDIKLKLSASLKFLENKLKNCPNKNYLNESDEDWVDEYMPN